MPPDEEAGPARQLSRISFGLDDNGQEEGWMAVSVKMELQYAMDPRTTAVIRVLFAARAKANRIGHANFSRFGLQDILGHDVGPGERKLAGETTVRKAIKDAIALGWLEPSSMKNCLVLPSAAAQTEWRKRDAECAVHDIGRRKGGR